MTLGKLRKLNLVGLDGDMERLRWAQRERVTASLLTGDIFDLPVADELLTRCCLVKCSSISAMTAACEIYRTLKPGGILGFPYLTPIIPSGGTR